MQKSTSSPYILNRSSNPFNCFTTLIEVKRSTDTRIRREVVGQMLDYAANAVSYWSVDTIKSLYEVRCEKESVDFEQTLESHLGPDCSYEEYLKHAWQYLTIFKYFLTAIIVIGCAQ